MRIENRSTAKIQGDCCVMSSVNGIRKLTYARLHVSTGMTVSQVIIERPKKLTWLQIAVLNDDVTFFTMRHRSFC